MKLKLFILSIVLTCMYGCNHVPILDSFTNNTSESGMAASIDKSSTDKNYDKFTPKTAYYATAVTRPAACNDFPVNYRIQIPEVDERVRPVDRTTLSSISNEKNASTQCNLR
jgi:hypothetical protein